MWQYYDFDVNWTEFLLIWNSYEVQVSIILDVEHWREFGFFKRYKDNDPLWKESKSMYWNNKILTQAHDQMKNEQHIKKFKTTMNSFGLFQKNTAKAYEAICFKHIVNEFIPKPNTIHAFIMQEGRYIFKNTLALCAKLLFPGEKITFKAINTILIPERQIIFNLYDYYFLKYDKNLNSIIIQEDYNNI
jgi:hypothetical protein